jgi:hypothetical protein
MIINNVSFPSLKKAYPAFVKNRKAGDSSDQVKNRKSAFLSTRAKSTKQSKEEFKEKYKDMLNPASKMSDSEKSTYEEKINRKIKNGEKLSGQEMQYLQMNNPGMFAMVCRIQMQRQALEDRLKSCRSKVEVEEAYCISVSNISRNDPAREPVLAAYSNVIQKFRKSSEYTKLPQTAEDKGKKRN